jgi:hypothetical protein
MRFSRRRQPQCANSSSAVGAAERTEKKRGRNRLRNASDTRQAALLPAFDEACGFKASLKVG